MIRFRCGSFGVGAMAAALALAGCADLGPVRDFGKSAAAIAAFPVAGDTYRDSAVASEPYVRASPASFVAEPARARQVRAATEAEAQLGRYFALLARLAGEDTYSLDAEIATMGKGATSLAEAGWSKTAVDASTRLTQVLARHATSGRQVEALRSLVREGGPSAMQLLEALRQVSGDWTAQVENDARQVDQTLQVAAMPRDVAPLVRLLADDRRAELGRDYAARLKRMRASTEALDRIRTAHAELASHLDDLDGPTLRERLRSAAADLRALRISSGAWLAAR